MSAGKILSLMIVLCAVVAGGALYYLQVYAFYEDVVATGEGDVLMTPQEGGAPEPIAYTNFRGIDADSSPIRYRACFETETGLDTLADTYLPYDGAVPLEAPGWFDCFNADEIGAALEAGTAQAFTGTANIEYGIDRIVAVNAQGQGFVWHQINHCGEVVFDGQPAPEDCPEPPEGY